MNALIGGLIALLVTGWTATLLLWNRSCINLRRTEATLDTVTFALEKRLRADIDKCRKASSHPSGRRLRAVSDDE